MFTIENRTTNPRIFIDQSGKSVVVGVNAKREVNLDQATADLLADQIDKENARREEESQAPFGLSVTGTAEKPDKRVRLSAPSTGSVFADGEGDPLEPEEEDPAPRGRGGRRKPAKLEDES